MQQRFVSHTSKFHEADLSVQRSNNLNQLLDSTVLRLHGFLLVVLFTWNNKVLLRSWSICIYLNMLVAPVTMQKELPPIEIIKREGMHSTGQGKAMNISIAAPTPTLHPPCLSSTSNVLPSAGRRAHYIELKPLLYVRSLVMVKDMNNLCYMHHCFIQSSYS